MIHFHIILYFHIYILSIITSSHAYHCSENESPVQVFNTQVYSNGCSKPSFIQVIGEEDFTYCCDRHDACYAMCESSKVYCDSDFEKCMKKLCKTNFSTNPDCIQAASTYAMGTQMFGLQGYEESQTEFCTCIDSTQVLSHYIELIDNFYEKYVDKDQRKDGKEIITKSKNAKNIGNDIKPVYRDIYKIYYELHKKYDNAIKHVESRVSKNPPRPILEL